MCIYCREIKPLAAFNREHVLPDSFGRFQNTLTLVVPDDPGVCESCNSFFGNSIDRVLARDSFDALLRLRTGIKPSSEIDDLFHGERVCFQMPERSPLGPLYLEVQPTDDGKHYHVVPRPQVRFARFSEGFICIREEQLASDPRENPDVDINQMTLFWSKKDLNAKDRLIAVLARHGIKFHPRRELSRSDYPMDSEGDVFVGFVFDSEVARAVAKITFNYLAKVVGIIHPQMIFFDSLDKVRRFIRYNEGNWDDIVRYKPKPILIGDTEQLRQTESHVITVTWNPDHRGGIIGQLSLFNHLTYEVLLCARPDGLWVDITSGHAYHLHNKTVERLISGRLVRPIMLAPP